MKSNLIIAEFIVISFLSICHLPASCQSFTKEVDKIYDFTPHEMSEKQSEEKLKPLDKFWTKVKSDTSKYLPALRIELARDRHQSFFYFDGSSLLLSLSNNQSDRLLAGEAVTKCNIDDIDRSLYVRRLNGLALNGVNITKAALKILADPNYSFYVKEHVMTFDREDCLAYCLLPLNPQLYTDTLLEMFETQDSSAQETILYTLWLGYTCKGDQLIQRAKADPKLCKTIRDGAAIIDYMSHMPFAAEEELKTSSIGDILSLRTSALKRFNEEGHDELLMSSMALRKKMACSN
jgi:hypothetical protein